MSEEGGKPVPSDTVSDRSAASSQRSPPPNRRGGEGEAASMRSKIESNTSELLSLIAARDLAERESKNTARYRSIRFMERKKLPRMTRKVRGERAHVMVGRCDDG